MKNQKTETLLVLIGTLVIYIGGKWINVLGYIILTIGFYINLYTSKQIKKTHRKQELSKGYKESIPLDLYLKTSTPLEISTKIEFNSAPNFFLYFSLAKAKKVFTKFSFTKLMVQPPKPPPIILLPTT